MVSTTPAALTPRKMPRQARASATLDAIAEATIQVLLASGPSRLTTTRVAARAGISVGSLYQYYPNKRALLYAVTGRYLQTVAGEVEGACAACHGHRLADMARVLIETYWHAKMVRADVTQALYLVAAGMDTTALVESFTHRIETATLAMFATAADAGIADPAIVNLTLLSALFGAVQQVFERNLPADIAAAAREQLVAMCQAFLGSVERRY